MNYIKPYLIFNCAVWLPWGLICIFDTGQIASIIGVTSVDATGNTDLRVMYGGFQFAVGLMAAAALYDQRLFKNVVFALAFLGTCMAISRGYGLLIDGSSTLYTWGVLAFEAFAGITGILWLRFLSRQQ
ncbi:MAG: DUF4345 family protein [Halioglobus sp.]